MKNNNWPRKILRSAEGNESENELESIDWENGCLSVSSSSSDEYDQQNNVTRFCFNLNGSMMM